MVFRQSGCAGRHLRRRHQVQWEKMMHRWVSRYGIGLGNPFWKEPAQAISWINETDKCQERSLCPRHVLLQGSFQDNLLMWHWWPFLSWFLPAKKLLVCYFLIYTKNDCRLRWHTLRRSIGAILILVSSIVKASSCRIQAGVLEGSGFFYARASRKPHSGKCAHSSATVRKLSIQSPTSFRCTVSQYSLHSNAPNWHDTALRGLAQQ